MTAQDNCGRKEQIGVTEADCRPMCELRYLLLQHEKEEEEEDEEDEEEEEEKEEEEEVRGRKKRKRKRRKWMLYSRMPLSKGVKKGKVSREVWPLKGPKSFLHSKTLTLMLKNYIESGKFLDIQI